MDTNAMIGNIEKRFDDWLDKFEERPINMGIKVIVVVLLLRWIWRAFK